MMRSAFVCLWLCFCCAFTASAQSSTQTPQAAASYWHQKKDWHTTQAPASLTSSGQSLHDYWQSNHPNIIVCPEFIGVGGNPPCFTPTGSASGSVFSGPNPVVGASVYLFVANVGAYGLPSASILIASPTTQQDSNGNFYAITDSNGYFYISGSFACYPGTQIYAYAVGGNSNTGTGYIGNNSAIGEMAVVGSCPSTNSPTWPPPAGLGNLPFISMTEVTTVAAAYAMSGFALDSTYVSSSGTTLAQVGVANAFANAGNLAGLNSGGAAFTITPNGNGTVPQTTIDTLANILASCIDSYTGSSASCSTLFNAVAPNGDPTGVPMDTATAAIYIAHNPGANVGTLFGLSNAANQLPYSPALAAQPNDFTVGINFSAVQFTGYDGDGVGVAIDGLGNVWITNPGCNQGSVVEMSSLGALLSPQQCDFTLDGIDGPTGVAIDSSGNAWVLDYEEGPSGFGVGNSITEITAGSNPVVTTYESPYLAEPVGITFDSAGNFWISNYYTNNVVELAPGLTLLQSQDDLFNPYLAADISGNVWVPNGTINGVTKFPVHGQPTLYPNLGVNQPYGVAADNVGNIWIGNDGNNSVSELSNGVNTANSPYTGNGIYNPWNVAIDGSGNAWITNLYSNSVTEISSSGVTLSGSNGYAASGFLFWPAPCAIDGSGDVWISNYLLNSSREPSMTELIGAATPVVTPLAVGAANGTLGTPP